jgi:hypothetical protein
MKLSLVLCLGFLGCLAMLLATGNKLLRLKVDVGANGGQIPDFSEEVGDLAVMVKMLAM